MGILTCSTPVPLNYVSYDLVPSFQSFNCGLRDYIPTMPIWLKLKTFVLPCFVQPAGSFRYHANMVAELSDTMAAAFTEQLKAMESSSS